MDLFCQFFYREVARAAQFIVHMSEELGPATQAELDGWRQLLCGA